MAQFSIITYAVLLILIMLRMEFAGSQTEALSFHELLDKLSPIPSEGAVFFSVSELCQTPSSVELWQMVGGREGLRRMCVNVKVLIQLAAFEEKADLYGGQPIAKQVRREALLVKWWAFQIRLAVLLTRTTRWSAPALLRMGKNYWTIVQRLLIIYDKRHASLSPALRAACNLPY